MIRLVVRSTAILLGASCALVIIGLFDLFLNLDLFSKEIESFLYGVFFSFMVLAIAGIALTFVLGIYEIVVLMRANITGTGLDSGWSNASLMRAGGGGLVILAGIILILNLANTRIEDQRAAQFRVIASEQADKFAPRINKHIPKFAQTPEATQALNDAIFTLHNLSLFKRATVILRDPMDDSAIFAHEITHSSSEGKFVRRFAVKHYELTALAVIQGENSLVDQFNSESRFRWMQVIPLDEQRVAVLYLIGNQREDFREY